MDILFGRNREYKLCMRAKEAVRRLGKANSDKLQIRIATLSVSANLLEFRRDFPEARCHELKGDRRGHFAVNLHSTWRLVFRPEHDPLPKLPDGGIDLGAVTRIEIVEVVDYHE